MSSRNQYDSRESRPSSRDRSPGRYNDSRDSDQYRGGAGRGVERRRSIPDSRLSSGAFASNRDSYNRESSRDFPPREPPRGPKALIDPPSGPRASSYGGDFRGDFGHRGDFRGRGGRGRARGGWRDDSRDRGREAERERDFVRDRREDRGPLPPFRDDRSRDRDWGRERESFRGRRAASPQLRARSPSYSTRDSRDVRDVPPNLEMDRTRRGSRDGPILAPSSSSESLQPYGRGFSGYGRVARGGRGRGRGTFYEDPRQQPGRSRSPDPQWARRPQPSATPPPQVPAFGSTSNSVQAATSTPTSVASSGPVPGIAVPTAPRSHVPASRNSFGRMPSDVNSVKWTNPDYSTPKQTKTAPETPKSTIASASSETGFSPPRGPAQNPDPYTNRSHHPAPVFTEKAEGNLGLNSKTIPDPIPQGPRSFAVTTQPPNLQERERPIISPDLGAETSQQLTSKPLVSSSPHETQPQTSALNQVHVPTFQESSQTRRPILSKRRPQKRQLKSNKITDELSEDNSTEDGLDSDSGVNDKYFEEEIAKIKEQIVKSSEQNELLPHTFPNPIPLKFPPAPSVIEELVAKDVRMILNAEKERKETAAMKKEATTLTSIEASAAGLMSKDQTGPFTESSLMSAVGKSDEIKATRPANTERIANSTETVEADQTKPSELTSPLTNARARIPTPTVEHFSREEANPNEAGKIEDLDIVQDMQNDLSTEPATPVPLITNSNVHKPTLIADVNDEDGDLSEAERLEELEAVRNMRRDIDRPIDLAALDLVRDSKGHEPTPVMNRNEDGTEREARRTTELEAVRRKMKTPSLSSLKNLPFVGIKKWDQDEEFLKTLDPKPAVEASLKKARLETLARRNQEQEVARQEWKERYLSYRKWTDLSDDPIAIKHRKRFQAAQAKEAAEASFTPAAEARQESRRNDRKFASQAELDRVIAESAREALEQEMRTDARIKTANEKEAIIPDMYWDDEERQEHMFVDRTHLVPFKRSFAVLEFGEPVDNFTEEECLIFEKTYLEFPKQWGKIAEALERRDFKACIQHYYLVKHESNLKGKVKALKPKRGRNRGRGGASGAKPKSNALMADLVTPDNEGDDKQENENGGERRRPRRAAAASQYNTAAEAAPSESENATPVPTPGRKSAATPKGEAVAGAAPAKRKAKGTPREKASKQSKNSQLLAAAPAVNSTRPCEPSNASTTSPEWKTDVRQSAEPNRFGPQYEGPPQAQAQTTFSPYIPMDTSGTPVAANFEMPQPVPTPERVDSAPPMSFDVQDRRNIQQTSSYWSVPEQTDFPALLRHFGTDWHGIAKWMTSKTHIMVKNYYQRQVDSGKMSEWEEIARDADEKRERGESTGPLPTPTILPKRRYDGPPGSFERSDSVMNGTDDVTTPGGQTMVMPKTSPPQPQPQPQPKPHPQPSLSTRFPALAQAGPVPQPIIQPVTSAGPSASKHYQQPIQQHIPQQIQQQPRPPRGPTLGYFNTERDRSISSPANPQQARHSPHASESSISQRSLMAAQEAQLERQQALKIEQQQQQQAMEREREQREQREQREHRERLMKQENEMHSLHQYEPYSSQVMQSNVMAHSRVEAPPPLVAADIRRTAPPQQYQPRNPQVRNLLSDKIGGQQMPSSPSPALPRVPLNAPPTSQEQYSAPQPPPLPQAPTPPVRQQETVRKTSSIMSLLNNDEPSEPRPQPPKRVSEFATNTIQVSRTPPPREQMYSQPPRQAVNPQPPHIRRDSSLGDIHSAGGGYGRSSGPSQSTMRLKESPYSATPPVQPAQAPRQQIASPLDLAPPSERDYYQRQPPQYLMQQQQNAVSSPQLGPSYHAQGQQQQPPHRQLAFGQTQPHAASPPPTQYVPQHSVHRSRQSSFDSRYATPVNASAAPAPPQQGYSHAPPQHHGTPLSMQYQTQHALQPSRYAAPPPQSGPPTSQQMSQQLAPQQQPSQPQHPYGQPPSHPMHQHSSSIGPPRSYTPTSYENRGYGPPPPSQQAPLSQERMAHEQEAMMRREIHHQQRPSQDHYDSHYERHRRMEDAEYQRRMDEQRRR